MKLTYEVHCKPLIGHEVDGHAGFSSGEFSTSAGTPKGIVKAMRKDAERALQKRIQFYEKYESARKMDVYDEDHVWHYSTWARVGQRVVRFDAFAIKRDGRYNPVEFAECGVADTTDEWNKYRATCDYYASLVR